MFFVVRNYVEGMKNSTQLLDLLAVVGSEDIEPTRAAAGRQALYPDVRFSHIIFIPSFPILAQVSPHCDASGWC